MAKLTDQEVERIALKVVEKIQASYPTTEYGSRGFGVKIWLGISAVALMWTLLYNMITVWLKSVLSR